MAWVELGNGWQSPRISFSVDLSQTDMISPEKRRREDAAPFDFNTEFEFCTVSNNIKDDRDTFFGEALISADELFVDGKLLPQIRPLEAQPITIACHLSLESSRCPSPVRSASYPPSKEVANASGLENANAAFKSGQKPSSKWKEMFKRSNKEYFCATSKESDEFITKESSNNVKRSSSGKSLWPFSRSGGETRGNGLFCSLPFSRSKSAVERKSKPGPASAACYRSMSVGAQSALKETETTPLPDSKPDETTSLKTEDLKRTTKRMPDLPKPKGSSPGRVMRTRGSPARNYGRGSPGKGVANAASNGRFMVRNLERCSVKALNSPRPGRPMAEGLVKSNSNLGHRVSPVLNVMPACIGPVGGRNGPGLFGFRAFFSSKKHNGKSSNHSASTNRKKGA